MFKNKLGEYSPIPKFIHLKIRRRDGVESLTTLEEGEFKVPIDGCIKTGHDKHGLKLEIKSKGLKSNRFTSNDFGNVLLFWII